MIKRAQVLTLALGVSVAVFAASAQGRAVPEPPTFARDIAPIIFQNCSHCHRPGESGPFNLLTYQDLRKRARQIVEVTRSGFMPPWLPEPGYGEFAGERRLTREQIATLATWAEGGTPLGDPQEIPPLPEWTEGWQLGEPDLVITPSATVNISGTPGSVMIGATKMSGGAAVSSVPMVCAAVYDENNTFLANTCP